MHSYKNLHIIGTSHIAAQSIKQIEQYFSSYNPDIICVELDAKRLHGLLTNAKPNYSLSGIGKYGLQGYLFAIIGSFIQKKLGNIVGIKPGSDMLTAVNLARTNRKQLELVDQDIEVTLKNFSKYFSFKEKMRLVWDIVKSPFSKEKIRVDLSTVPASEVIHKLITQLKNRYPGIYKSLIEDRNKVMAKNTYALMKKHSDKKILLVIGAGHEMELLQLIKMEDFKRDNVKN